MFSFDSAPAFSDEVEDGDVMMKQSIVDTGDVYGPNVSSYNTKGRENALELRTVALNPWFIFWSIRVLYNIPVPDISCVGRVEWSACKRHFFRLIKM
jgi:hypothetical protein